MSSIDQVLSAAKAIAQKGHTPCLALIKARVGNHIPMPVLIQGLKQFKAMSEEQVQQINDVEPQATSAPETQPDIDQLVQQMSLMQQQINQLQQRIDALESQANEHKG
ncbi:hypothetical protein ACFOD0_12920 [Shewanella intestini]|uniref:KfrA N-terminal DNA-binding domain-containing protein n=1 Tax=Shewanella intestini TaxID=2017544 RepID=A0ABS5I114_9GAMM|nr:MULTISPECIES: hypothetical protein [Shewanella]MBR9727379.1 hypothetical protein [Shewanella intestini]MRG35571.1 hypothetical protein [Shewanella sp. XMDDZSB0408]